MTDRSHSNDSRILVVDDNEAIHDDFRRILEADSSPSAVADEAELDEAEAVLFGRTPSRVDMPTFAIDSAFQGAEAVEKVRLAVHENRGYPVAFVDVRMPPGFDGIETVQRIWQIDPTIQIVLCTAYSDHTIEDIVRQLGVTDSLLILKKPFDVAEAFLLAVTLTQKWQMTRESVRRIETQKEYISNARRVVDIVERCQEELETAHGDLQLRAGDLSERLQQRTVEIIGTRDVAVYALAQLAESRDQETGDHLRRLQAYAQIIAERLAEAGPYQDQIDAEFLDDFYRSTPLHDIGKVGIPDEILLKPGRLTPGEFEVMKRHTVIGAEALEKAASHTNFGGFLTMAAEIARRHHERWDGAGYPNGLAGQDIPLSARITAVADVFDALTSKRVYKDAYPSSEARREIVDQRGKHFDPACVDAFIDTFDELLKIKDAINSDVVTQESDAAAQETAAVPQETISHV